MCHFSLLLAKGNQDSREWGPWSASDVALGYQIQQSEDHHIFSEHHFLVCSLCQKQQNEVCTHGTLQPVQINYAPCPLSASPVLYHTPSQASISDRCLLFVFYPSSVHPTFFWRERPHFYVLSSPSLPSVRIFEEDFPSSSSHGRVGGGRGANHRSSSLKALK